MCWSRGFLHRIGPCGRQGHGKELAAARVDILDGAAAALEGERDPRCLLAAFAAVAALAQAFAGAVAAGSEVRPHLGEQYENTMALVWRVAFPKPRPCCPPALSSPMFRDSQTNIRSAEKFTDPDRVFKSQSL